MLEKDERTGWRHEVWPNQCLGSETADLVTRCRRFVLPSADSHHRTIRLFVGGLDFLFNLLAYGNLHESLTWMPGITEYGTGLIILANQPVELLMRTFWSLAPIHTIRRKFDESLDHFISSRSEIRIMHACMVFCQMRAHVE